MIGVCSINRHALILFCIAIQAQGNVAHAGGINHEGAPMELMTSPETARYLKLSERTLAAMRARGDGPQFTRLHPDGRGVRYRLADLDRWIDARGLAA